jgi:hexosaminidase
MGNLNLMPVPASVQRGTGSIRMDTDFSVKVTGYTEPRLERAVERFRDQLSRQTGILFAAQPAVPVVLVVHTDHAGKPVQEVGEDESYVLEVTATGAKLTAPTPLGSMHGLQTFLQLVGVSAEGFAAPVVTIHDSPRFPWRGLMIDSARHFMPLAVIKRNLDGLEAVKMNVFHWHLSENQGFRVESKRFPKLTEMGSDGLFYSQEEVRDVIAYARDRGIRVVPEFDLPGHSTAWFVGYPELASGSGPYQIERRWGIFDPAFDPTKENTYNFLDEFIAEMSQLFPDKFFHVGGDEVNGKEWDKNPKIQEFKQAHGLKDNVALQGYFNKRLQPIVSKHGKSMIGWDEVLDPSLPKDITVQSWRGPDSLAEAAKQGYRGILSSGWYLDLGWSAARHYAVDPLAEKAAALSSEEKSRVLGGESCIWSEYVNQENLDSRIWPRNAAIAERLWSPEGVRDTSDMYRRLDVVSNRLKWLGLTHKSYYVPMLQRIAGAASSEQFAALRILADVVEPVKDYTREETVDVEPTSATPLHRLVDAVPLESEDGRRFNELVDEYVKSSCRDSKMAAKLRARFALWQANDDAFQSLAQTSFLAKQVEARSRDLTAIGGVGLAALDSLEKGQRTSDDGKAQQLAIITEAEKAKTQLLLIPALGVRKLVEATAGVCRAQ